MTERLADSDRLPNHRHRTLYKHWVKNGAALLISGNIMVDEKYVEAAGNVVLDARSPVLPFQSWTNTVSAGGTEFWAQINHPGRQASIFSTLRPLAPSAVRVKKLGLFAKPKVMTNADIERTIAQFVTTARRAKEVGFSGVQIHAAHGYLISQFLSPHTNRRTDPWGGDLTKRARFLFTIVDKVRAEVGKDFPVSVKLNSADFQRGGFSQDDALWIIGELERKKVDLLEISGGTYESIVFLSKANHRASSIAREGYFLEFAKRVRAQTKLPIMVTGGFRSLAFCEQVLVNGELDMIGFARPFLLDDNFPQPFFTEAAAEIREPELTTRVKPLQGMEEAGWYDYQIERLGRGQGLDLDYQPLPAVLRLTKNEFLKGIRNKLL